MKLSRMSIKMILTYLLLIFTFTSLTAKAITAEDSLEHISSNINLEMDSGASIRLVEGSTGIRFVSHICNSEYQRLKEEYSISFGTLIIPKDYLEDITDNTFTKQYLEENQKAYLNISQEKWFSIDETNDLRYFSAVITNILDRNLYRDFIARSYYDIVINNETHTVYSDIIQNNHRNLYDLTQVVLEEDSLSQNQQDILYSILNRVGIKITILSVNSEISLDYSYDLTNNYYEIDYDRVRHEFDYVYFTITPKNNHFDLSKITNIYITGKGRTSNVSHNSNGTITLMYSIDSYINSNLH